MDECTGSCNSRSGLYPSYSTFSLIKTGLNVQVNVRGVLSYLTIFCPKLETFDFVQ